MNPDFTFIWPLSCLKDGDHLYPTAESEIKMKTTLIAVFVTVLSVGCQQAPLTDFRENAQEVIEEARGRADEWRELSAEELQELWAIEYTSLEVAHADFARADELLNEMGRERWECYHVSGNGQRRVFYFKRNESNLTAYLTNLLRLGSIAF